jgi:hypothetical protein
MWIKEKAPLRQLQTILNAIVKSSEPTRRTKKRVSEGSSTRADEDLIVEIDEWLEWNEFDLRAVSFQSNLVFKCDIYSISYEISYVISYVISCVISYAISCVCFDRRSQLLSSLPRTSKNLKLKSPPLPLPRKMTQSLSLKPWKPPSKFLRNLNTAASKSNERSENFANSSRQAIQIHLSRLLSKQEEAFRK